MSDIAKAKAVAPIIVGKVAARRFLVVRSGLGRHADDPHGCGAAQPDALNAVKALEYVQVDPMRVLECNHNLVLGARVPSYSADELDQLLYVRRELVEVVARNRYIVPVADYWMFRARFAEMERSNRPRLDQLEDMMGRVLQRIAAQGAMSSLDFDETETVSGWWDPDGESRTRAVRQALEWLWHFGRLAISHRVGSRRYFDLPERLYGQVREPAGAAYEPGSADDGHSRELDALLRKYFRATGLVDVRDWGFGWARYAAAQRKGLAERFVAAGELVPVQLEGSAATYYVPAEEAGNLTAAADRPLASELRILPPLDNLIWLRGRLADIFGFDYTWEAYVPKPKRVYGPYTCPILYADRFAGRIDAKVDRDRRVLVVNGLWWEQDDARPPLDQFRAYLTGWACVSGADEVEDPSHVLG